jgi:CubicO group peptidase (beta-lactamase class C family)
MLALVSSCTDENKKLKNKGKIQQKYVYKLPEKVDDGWEISSLDQEGIDPVIINDLIQSILSEEYKNIHSILLVKNGKLILEEYFHGYSREKFHQLRSATKSIGSVLTGIAIDHGFLKDANEKIYPYFKINNPDRKWDERAKDVRMRHLLTMTSGYDCDDHKSNFKCERGMYKSKDWIEYALNLPMVNQPGEHWAYNSASLWLVGEMISKSSNMTIPAFAKSYLFNPLGITEFEWGFSPNGRAWIAGNAKMKPRDMAKFGYMVLNDGRWLGKQIVSKKWLEESTSEHVPLPDMRLYGGNYGYGYLWWLLRGIVNEKPVDAIAASGNGGQIIALFPKVDLVAVFTGGNYNNSLSAQPIEMLIKFILPAMI